MRGAAEENVEEGLVDEERTSLGEDSEAIERGQEMDRLIGPGSIGEAEGAGLVLRDFTGCFQSIRPVNTKDWLWRCSVAIRFPVQHLSY